MNIYEELRRNRAVFAATGGVQAASGALEYREPARPALPGGGGLALPEPRGETPAGGGRRPVPAYSLREAEPGLAAGRPPVTAGQRAARGAEPVARQADAGARRRSAGEETAPRPLAVETAPARGPAGAETAQGAAREADNAPGGAPGDAVDGLLRRLESESRLQSQLLGEE